VSDTIYDARGRILSHAWYPIANAEVGLLRGGEWFGARADLAIVTGFGTNPADGRRIFTPCLRRAD
jgi:hypothetical protein